MIAAIFLAAQSQASLDVILSAPELNGAWIGVVVAKPDGEIVFARNADRRFMPASNTKLFSAAYAFHELGADNRSTTKFWNSTDTLFIECNGDPLLTWQDWAALRKHLIPSQKKVALRQDYNPGPNKEWEMDDIPFRYGASISAFTIDSNAFELWASKGRIEPLRKELGVHIKVVKSETEPVVDYDPIRKKLVVTGKLPNDRTRLERLAIPAPTETIARVLGCKIVEATKFPNRPPDLVWKSKTVAELAAASLVPSDNNVAENLMFLATKGESKTFQSAATRMAEFLTKIVQIPQGEVRLRDGSGVSRHNLVTPRAIVRLLQWVRTQSWSSQFEAALATPGNGTLRTRLNGSTFRGKTGTADTNSNLSGFIGEPGQSPWTISIMMNHALAETSHLHRIQDQIIQEIEKWTRTGMNSVILSQREGPRSNPVIGGANGHRIPRPAPYGVASRPGQDRRTQPAHATAHRTQRMAVRTR